MFYLANVQTSSGKLQPSNIPNRFVEFLGFEAKEVKGEPILMWDAPEAEHKNIWSLTRDQRAAVLESREILKKNQKKEKQAQHDEELRRRGSVQMDVNRTSVFVAKIHVGKSIDV